MEPRGLVPALRVGGLEIGRKEGKAFLKVQGPCAVGSGWRGRLEREAVNT